MAALADLPQQARLRESGLGSKFSSNRKRRSARDLRKSTSIPQLRQHLDRGVKLQQYEHHLCHAASTFYTSEFDRALILTLDGGSASRCGQISLGEKDEIRPLRTMQFPNCLGWLYSRITALLGLRPHYDEHKVQWIGRQGQPEYLPVFRKLFRNDAHGLPVLDSRYFASGPDERGTFSPQFYRELKIHKDKFREDPAICAALARSAQLFLEETVLEIAHHFQAQTGTDSLCIAGGVFLNVLLVRALEKRSTFDRVHVQRRHRARCGFPRAQEAQRKSRPRPDDHTRSGPWTRLAGNQSRSRQLQNHLQVLVRRRATDRRKREAPATRQNRRLVPGPH